VIEERFEIPFVAELALREKQIQQNYRPVIAVHKWFARRPGTLFRSLLLSEFCDVDLPQAFFTSQNLSNLRIADPFMGGGIPLLEANRVGSAVLGFDINPMAWWVVREEIETLDVAAYRKAADELRRSLDDAIGRFYRTISIVDRTQQCPVKSYFWVKTQVCDACHQQFDLFPGYRLARDVRHPKHVLVCARCGELNEVVDVSKAGSCKTCCSQLRVSGNVTRGKASCPHCGRHHRVPDVRSAPYKHRLFALEYINANGVPRRDGRLFKKADEQDLANVAAAEKLWSETEPRLFRRVTRRIDYTAGAIRNTVIFSTHGSYSVSNLVRALLPKFQMSESVGHWQRIFLISCDIRINCAGTTPWLLRCSIFFPFTDSLSG
jgi:putative DNA methylase